MSVDRILQYLSYKGISKHKFYLKTGLSNGFLDKVKDIGASKIEVILYNYPDINPIWLITGKGSMLLKPDNSDLVASNLLQRKRIKTVLLQQYSSV